MKPKNVQFTTPQTTSLLIMMPGNITVPRLGATKNDLHVQNYEINDTASGAEIPLVATPKSLH